VRSLASSVSLTLSTRWLLRYATFAVIYKLKILSLRNVPTVVLDDLYVWPFNRRIASAVTVNLIRYYSPNFFEVWEIQNILTKCKIFIDDMSSLCDYDSTLGLVVSVCTFLLMKIGHVYQCLGRGLQFIVAVVDNFLPNRAHERTDRRVHQINESWRTWKQMCIFINRLRPYTNSTRTEGNVRLHLVY